MRKKNQKCTSLFAIVCPLAKHKRQHFSCSNMDPCILVDFDKAFFDFYHYFKTKEKNTFHQSLNAIQVYVLLLRGETQINKLKKRHVVTMRSVK